MRLFPPHLVILAATTDEPIFADTDVPVVSVDTPPEVVIVPLATDVLPKICPTEYICWEFVDPIWLDGSIAFPLTVTLPNGVFASPDIAAMLAVSAVIETLAHVSEIEYPAPASEN